MNKEKYPEGYKYLMTINVPTKEESANIVYANNIETLLVYIYKAIEKNPNQRQFQIGITNFEALYETTKTDIESLAELAYILSADEQTIKKIQEKH